METENKNHLPLVGRSESEAIRVGDGACNFERSPTRNLQKQISTSPQGGGDIVAIARTWIGTPYAHQASVKGVGCDCLGLLRGVWRELHGEDAEAPPPYSPDWAEATGEETLYAAMKRHLVEIDPRAIAPGDIALFRMMPRGPAKHCVIVGSKKPGLTLIHARQNKQVSEEMFTIYWRRRLSASFRLILP